MGSFHARGLAECLLSARLLDLLKYTQAHTKFSDVIQNFDFYHKLVYRSDNGKMYLTLLEYQTLWVESMLVEV